ncbi:hypothetical protein DM01DRAFT_1378861 [Hesseltinella vesiculosa]|uniref:Retrotransposon gag domain-containing protein n=1 Tax=Hesseltinella vesiculosa TaxID=101127 RepID=A0A1X2G2W0_9FUNG|nr:hypothetical protein DM01DRAFT_1378861 [Hesseltinella vesiculosa]
MIHYVNSITNSPQLIVESLQLLNLKDDNLQQQSTDSSTTNTISSDDKEDSLKSWIAERDANFIVVFANHPNNERLVRRADLRRKQALLRVKNLNPLITHEFLSVCQFCNLQVKDTASRAKLHLNPSFDRNRERCLISSTKHSSVKVQWFKNFLRRKNFNWRQAKDLLQERFDGQRVHTRYVSDFNKMMCQPSEDPIQFIDRFETARRKAGLLESEGGGELLLDKLEAHRLGCLLASNPSCHPHRYKGPMYCQIYLGTCAHLVTNQQTSTYQIQWQIQWQQQHDTQKELDQNP